MSTLVCDICAGKLVMGLGGIAVCETCGLEYSKDRITEKFLEEKGPIRSGYKDMIYHWMKMGKAATEAGNYEEAYDYYTKVVELDPDIWRAIYEKGKAGAWQSTIDNLRTSELHQAVNEALIIITDLDLPEDLICQLKNEFAAEIVKLSNTITDRINDNFNISQPKYFNLHWDKMWERRERYITNVSIIENAMLLIKDYDDELSKANIIEFKKRICSDLCVICMPISYWFDQSEKQLLFFGFDSAEKQKYIEKFWNYVFDIREDEPDYRSAISTQPDPFESGNHRVEDVFEYWKNHSDEQFIRREREKSKERYDQYWDKHSTEKSLLLSRREKIKTELASVKTLLNSYALDVERLKEMASEPLTVEKQLLEKKMLRESLNDKLESMGAFSGKQKKSIQRQIDVLDQQLSELEESVSRQKEEIEKETENRIQTLENESKPLRDREEKLKSEMENINFELSKAR